MFRIVTGEEYLDNFASDRSHMVSGSSLSDYQLDPRIRADTKCMRRLQRPKTRQTPRAKAFLVIYLLLHDTIALSDRRQRRRESQIT